MNNPNMQLGQRGVPTGAMDVWNQNTMPTQLGMPSPMQSAPPPVSPVAIVQKLLRGRVALAIVLGFIGAIMGAAGGFMSQAPQYNASGVISINPVKEGLTDKMIPYYQNFMNTETMTLVSPQIINRIPEFEPWKSLLGKNNDALADLANNAKVVFPRQSQILTIDYATTDPKVAAAGVSCMIKSYQAQYKDYSKTPLAKQLDQAEAKFNELDQKNQDAQKQINDIIAIYGTPDLQPLVSSAQATVEAVTRELRGNENNFKAVNDAVAARKDSNGQIPIEDLAAVEPILAKMLSDLQAAQIHEKVDEGLLGPKNRQVQQQKTAIEITQSGVDGIADTMRKHTLAIIPDFVKGGSEKVIVTPGDLAVLEKRVLTLRDELASATKKRDSIAADAGKVATQTTNMKTFVKDMQDQTDRLTTLRYAAAAAGDLRVLKDGSYAVKANDKKILFGAAGAIVGACFPVGLLMLMGLMDTRFRYSDDAAGHSMAGIPLLGILPNLPDRLSDPAQASIAAHCVHQIRTMLQLNSMREHSTAFAVTSASSGDGKTSLSLALGLSFAASGSRTLLIDADLVGGGLTSRLGNDTAVGIVDALAGVGLEECVQPTDVADLSLLPIGAAQAHHAGSFSPPAVRKLLAEIRKHYEVIIIDTGPVMGSIEATPICASVDGVVLTVARGQSRPLVERAITHLQSIGAKVSGVVFNRAQHKDFEQSIGAISVRSAARSTTNGSGHNARKNGDMGAVAAAVRTSVRNEN